MSKNIGKIFEGEFQKSIPEYCLVHRLRDSAQSYNQSSKTVFTWHNECDFFVFDSIRSKLFCLELKTTKQKYMQFQSSKDEDDKMIKYHQIESLRKLSKYENVYAGFILNFRDEENDNHRTYFLGIDLFDEMIIKIKKKSFNEIDLVLHGAKKIEGKKIRTRYTWDLDGLISNL